MSTEELAKTIIDKMYAHDAFSQWLGIERIEDGPGISVLRMTVREEMTNGFQIAHGGITFSLADSAFAFACNSPGKKAVSIECDINHLKTVNMGDILIAKAEEVSCSNKLGVYHVKVVNQKDETVALFKGLAYRTSEDWDV
ncbi:MAG TPA: hydroxyphenylacetyl-CoA thioesterase PaaI [Saprospiraceae bacterium]|nr:hydroxyphenylacetyl-CoA thioesterase PaaI [Saprospiraceae bacterium]